MAESEITDPPAPTDKPKQLILHGSPEHHKRISDYIHFRVKNGLSTDYMASIYDLIKHQDKAAISTFKTK